jgi:hypothetical protein
MASGSRDAWSSARGTQSSWRHQCVRSSYRRRELAARVAELAGARAAAPCGACVARELLPQGRLPTSARPGAEPLAAGSGSPLTARAAAPRGQSAQVCARQPPHGARRRQPPHRARRWSRLHSPRSSARAHQRCGAPLPRGQEEELRAVVMVANRQGFGAVAGVCCMCWGCF